MASSVKSKELEIKTKKAHKIDALEANRRENLRCAQEFRYGDFVPYWAKFDTNRSQYRCYRTVCGGTR